MANPINYVPLNTPMFDGSGDPDGKDLVRKLGRIARTWAVFFSSESGWMSQGLHAERVGATAITGLDPGAVPDGALYVETDRASIYESRFAAKAQAWVFVLGRMQGLLASRPADLGTNDAGFIYSATDALDYRWSGTAWATLDTVRGGANLTHVGRLTKVSAAGTLTESSLTDNGTKVTGTEPLELDTGATPAEAQVKLRANALGILCLLSYAADNQELLLDAEWTGAAYVARSTTACRVMKFSGHLRIAYATGLTPGNAFAWTGDAFDIDLANGRCGFANNAAAYQVDVTGDENVTGVYRVAGTQVVSTRGAALTAAGAAVAGSAGATYPGTAQAAINDLITLANNLRTRVNELEARLSSAAGHGLFT